MNPEKLSNMYDYFSEMKLGGSIKIEVVLGGKKVVIFCKFLEVRPEGKIRVLFVPSLWSSKERIQMADILMSGILEVNRTRFKGELGKELNKRVEVYKNYLEGKYTSENMMK